MKNITMDIHKQEIKHLLGCSSSTLNTYLGRYEFSHVAQFAGMCYGITEKDIDKLRLYISKKQK